jgi:hypothetical protein
MAKKTTKTPHEIRFILNKIVETIGHIVMTFFHLLFRLFSFMLEVFKSIWLGLSVFIISVSILFLSICAGMWLLGDSLGLTDSEALQTKREENLNELFELWDTTKKERKQYKIARKEKVRIAEITGVSCQENSDCQTPSDYLIQSSCPYESRCYEQECAVVCPK